MKLKLIILVSLALLIAAVFIILLKDVNFQVLNAKGVIAEQQRDLLVFTTLLSLVVIIPVFALTIYIAYTYRASNTKAKYTPNWSSNKKLEAIWWGIPLLIIVLLAVITWVTTHSLDPYRPLQSDKKPVTIQVVALQWKWLFLYPEQGIATVNYLQVPEDTPIKFVLTADAPMNSFWIPQLGGQIYTMSGMTTKLHLQADTPGSYMGQSANISGDGFADMNFVLKATNQAEFSQWVSSVKRSGLSLDDTSYSHLASPWINEEPLSFATYRNGLFSNILMKYMSPDHRHSEMSDEGIEANATQGAEHAQH